MSQYKFSNNGKNILCGYDTALNYVFMVIFDENEEMVYSNMNDTNICFMNHLDFDYFVQLAKEQFSIEFPSDIIQSIKNEVALKASF